MSEVQNAPAIEPVTNDVPLPGDQSQQLPADNSPPEGEGQPTEPKDKKDDAPQFGDWRDDRFKKMTYQTREAQRVAEAAEKRARETEERAAAFEAELHRLKNGGQPPEGHQPKQPQGQPPQSQADIDRIVNERAAQIAAEREFNDASNRTYERGIATHGEEFGKALGVLQEMAQHTDPKTSRQFVEAINDLDNGADVLHALSADPNRMYHVLHMPVRKQAFELAKFATTLGSPAATPTTPAIPVSRAPAPVRPVTGRAGSGDNLADPNMPIEKWMEIANKKARGA
jgi:hypothetical protein